MISLGGDMQRKTYRRTRVAGVYGPVHIPSRREAGPEGLRGGPMNLEELRERVDTGEIDTVVLAFCDMQGRLAGKRFTARHFLDEVVEHGAEGCNYLLAVDVEM